MWSVPRFHSTPESSTKLAFFVSAATSCLRDSFSARRQSFSLVNLAYVVVGRYAGLLPYYFPALFAIVNPIGVVPFFNGNFHAENFSPFRVIPCSDRTGTCGSQ